MPIETEKKFIVIKELWEESKATSHHSIIQGFLHNTPELIVRVRLQDDQGFVTIKGKQIGASRPEYEYAIPIDDARELIKLTNYPPINKTRFIVPYADKIWEVDVFHGANEGLIIAELELENDDESFDLPEWVGEDVTERFEYTNAQLFLNPFSNWSKD